MRKRCSSIHFFSSTSVRCMRAICPAGPPKLMSPIRAQTRSASCERRGLRGADVGARSGRSICHDPPPHADGFWPRASCASRRPRRGTSDRRRRRAAARRRAARGRRGTCARGPAMPPAGRPTAAPGRAWPCRRRARCAASCSSGSRLELELLDHGVEGARLAAMAPEHALDVERRRTEALGNGRDLGRRHEQEHGRRIDEAPDQPRAGDAVDLGPRARHPDRAAPARRGREACRCARAARRPCARPRSRLPASARRAPRAAARRRRPG